MDDAQARALLREHGEEPPARGRLAPYWHEMADELTSGIPAAAPVGPEADEDFSPVAEAAPPPDDDAGPGLTETRPRKVASRTRIRPSLKDRLSGGTGKGKAPRKRHPRVSTASLISSVWGALGGLAGQIDRPVGACLQMQAPVAGVVLDDVVRDTFADKALQPLARAEDKAKKVAAIVGPPLCVAGLEMAQQLPEPQRKAREAVLWPMLIQMLMLGEDVAGEYADKISERLADEAPRRERAERMASAIFAMPGATAEAEPVPEPAVA